MLALFIFMLFYDNVSTAERASAIFYNPSSIGFRKGINGFIASKVEERKTSFETGLSIGMLGFGMRKKDENTSYTIASGGKIFGPLYLGSAYTFGDEKYWSIGTRILPLDVINLGARIDLKERPNYNLGLSFRPFTDRLTLFGECSYTNSLTYKFGGEIEPLDGIAIAGSLEDLKKLHFGARISFGGLRPAGIYSKNKKTLALDISNLPYQSVFTKKPEGIVKIVLDGSYPEERERGIIPFARAKPSFFDLLWQLKDISQRKECKGIFLVIKNPKLNITQWEEIREILEEMKKKAKKIFVFSEGYSLFTYFLASLADKIFIAPMGSLYIPGLYAERFFVKGTFEKLGIEPEFYRIGKYKSASEIFTRERMSEEDREQITALLKDVYKFLLDEISESRKLSKDSLEGIINEIGYLDADTALALGLIDFKLSLPEVDSFIKAKEKAKIIKSEEFLGWYKRVLKRSWIERKEKIALVVIEGNIVEGKSGEIPIIGIKTVGSETISSILEKLSKDKTIKAVVVRINSPGGSAIASDAMWQAVRRCAQKKPVIISMGRLATSGGYYVASAGTKILAENSTVTGSIGIISGKFFLKGFYDKLGITKDFVKLNPLADIFSDYRKFDEKGKEIIERMLQKGYKKFLERVSMGRGLSTEKVDSLGQGRVWSGKSAREKGLVDKKGGLLKAIDEAKRLAKIKEEVWVDMYPKPKSLLHGFGTFDAKTLFDEDYLYHMGYEIEIKP